MVNSFEQWLGKTVVLRLKTGDLRVPLRGTIVAESGGILRFRIAGGWDIGVYKSLILGVECENHRSQVNRATERLPEKRG